MTTATDMLREDHWKVKQLFREFEQTEDTEARRAIVESALVELEIHTKLEEDIFYPAVRKEADGEDTEELMNEAEQEHHVVDVIAQEILRLQPRDPEYAAKFTVLYENVEHHIEEEESEVLPKAEEMGPERLEELGRRMEQRKQELMTFGDRRTAATSRARPGSSRSASRTTGARGGSSLSGSGASRSKGASRTRSRSGTSR